MDLVGELIKIALTAGLSIGGTIYLLGRTSQTEANV